MLFDTHCHLQFNAYKDDADEVHKKCAEKGVMLNIVGSQRDTSERAIAYAEKYPDVYATVGLHPIHLLSAEVDEEEVNFKSREEKFDYDFYKKMTEHPKVIAIGECGLELYHLPKGVDEKSAIQIQTEAFIGQYKLAQELNLPMVIHVRSAHRQMIDLLLSLRGTTRHEAGSDEAIPQNSRQNILISSTSRGIASLPSVARNDSFKGVVHCYTSNWDIAKEYLDLGLYLGFTGVVTFPSKKTDPKLQEELLEVVKNCPLDRILTETDAPYLAPQKYRGQRCEPWMVEEVAAKIAEIKGLAVEEVKEKTFKNALKLFAKIHV